MKFSTLTGLLFAASSTVGVSAVAHAHHRRGHGHYDLAKRAAEQAADVSAVTPPTLKKRKNNKRSCTPKSGSTSSSGNNLASSGGSGSGAASGCFPALGFQMPANPPSSVNGWWCDPSTEYAFVGFSYEVTACQSPGQLKSEFKDIRNRFKGRYVRLYGACDNQGFYDSVVEAAWEAGIGVHALIWFGFTGGNEWQGRKASLVSSLQNNPKAKYVTRTVQFGSEPLFDSAIDPYQLASEVQSLEGTLKPLGISVTVSDMAYGFQTAGAGGLKVLQAVDNVHAHMLPFFARDASTGSAAWGDVSSDLNWFLQNSGGKKIYFSENGWPSAQSPGVQRNNDYASADVGSEQQYYDLLDSKCGYFKTVNGGGVAWFAHIYSDSQEPGYGILDTNGNTKFNFAPKTSC